MVHQVSAGNYADRYSIRLILLEQGKLAAGWFALYCALKRPAGTVGILVDGIRLWGE